MITLSKNKTKRLVAIQGWSGLVIGILLYTVVLTGAIAVFASEIGTWAVGGKKWDDALEDRYLSVALSKTIKTVDPDLHENIEIYSNSEGRLVFFYHKHETNPQGQPDDLGVVVELNPDTYEELRRREGYSADLFGHDPVGALDEFLVELHISLHAPHPYGLYATGIMGFAMLIAALTGLIIHRHLLKDLFLAPRISSALVNARDRHNLIGSWGLPFCIILSFSGAFLSFAVALGLPLIAEVAFGGSQFKMFETIEGDIDSEERIHRATMVHLDGVLAQSRDLIGSGIAEVRLHHWGMSNATIEVIHLLTDGSYIGDRPKFDATTGTLVDGHYTVGSIRSISDQVIDLLVALHFGDFAGLLSKVIWLAVGLAMAHLTWSGVGLWFHRRSGIAMWAAVSRALPLFGYGLPLALALCSVGFFLSLPFEATLFWTPAAFVMASTLILVWGYWQTDVEKISYHLQVTLGCVLIALPLLRILVTGFGWFAARDGGVVLFIDITLLATGLFYLRARLPSLRFRRTAEQTPAE